MTSPPLTCPQKCQRCQKIQKTKLKTTKIQPKLNKIWKTFRKQGFFDIFCSILMVFHSFFNFGWILALQLTRVDFSLVIRIFWNPWHPWGCINSGVKQNFGHLDQCVVELEWIWLMWYRFLYLISINELTKVL